MQVFRSKVSLLLLAMLILAFLFPLYFSWRSIANIDTRAILVLGSQIILLLIICYFIFDTKYLIKKDTLIIKIGFITYGEIAVNTITKIEKTHSILAAPAASLDRILVRYGKHGTVILSPKLKRKFIDELQKLNPTIISD